MRISSCTGYTLQVCIPCRAQYTEKDLLKTRKICPRLRDDIFHERQHRVEGILFAPFCMESIMESFMLSLSLSRTSHFERKIFIGGGDNGGPIKSPTPRHIQPGNRLTSPFYYQRYCNFSLRLGGFPPRVASIAVPCS